MVTTIQPQKLPSPKDSDEQTAQEIVFQNDDIEEDDEILDDVPSYREKPKNEAGGSTVNMASVVANPKIVSNNQTKMPAVETSKLGTATNGKALADTQFA